MRTKKSREKSKEIILMLFQKYPHLFDKKTHFMLPLSSTIIQEIVKDLNIHSDHYWDLKRAIYYYQSWNGYLNQVAFSRVKYNLWKEVTETTTAYERMQARQILIERKFWSINMEKVFTSRQLHVDKEINSPNTN